MKKFWIIALVIVVIVAVAFKLSYNKKQIDANARVETNNQETIPVKVIKAAQSSFDNTLSVSGIFNPWSEVSLMSEGQGKVTKINFETGQLVKEGEILATLDDELVKSQLGLAEATYQKAQRDFSKYSGLAAVDAVSNQQLEDIKLALKNAQTNLAVIRKQYDNTVIKATISGLITKKYVDKGAYLMPGMPVADITALNKMKFNARVAEDDINTVKPGMEVSLEIPSLGKEGIKGKVFTIQSKSDEARRYAIEVAVDNPGNLIKSGMFGTALMSASKKDSQGILIPRDCLNGSIKEPEVFIVKNNIALRTAIKIGKVTDDKVEVTAGINPGDWVVQSGQINLEDSTKVHTIE